MGHFLTVALSFPTVVYTVLLGVSLFYWVFVMVGAAHVNLLGEGAADAAVDAAADAALDGVAKGVLEGAAKGVLEGAADHLDGADGGDVGDAGGDVSGGGPHGIMAALKLRSAPATVVLSVLILFAWILNVLGMQVIASLGLEGAALSLTKIILLIATPLIALFPTAIVIRPLARVFTPPVATQHASLVGKLCTIRTGTVTDRFGEALLEDGGPGVVVRVRIDVGEKKLARGDQAVIVGYDADRQEFTVAPMDDLLEERPQERKGTR